MRGLKYKRKIKNVDIPTVALYTSAWIEMMTVAKTIVLPVVALYTSAWIEMPDLLLMNLRTSSRTLHECVD